MKKNEIRVSLRKEIKERIDYLATLMDMPTSRLLRLMIEEPTFINTINSNITMIEQLRKIKSNNGQLEFDFKDNARDSK